MQLETAKQAVIKAFSALASDEELEIDFHGGEPLLAFDLIRELCEWIWSRKWPAPYICFATTNGTLVAGGIKEWFQQNSEHFWLGLSLDGTREMHNLNRSESFDQIDANFFRSQWPSQPVKMTVSDKTLPFLAEGVEYLQRSGFGFSWNLAYGIDWSERRNLKEFVRQLRKLVDFYLEHPQFEVADPLAMGMEALSISKSAPQKWCGSGTHMRAVDIDGREYPCHMFLPITTAQSTGNIDWHCESTFIDTQCAACPILPMCPTCYGKNFIERGNIASRDQGLCDMFKVQALACTYLKASQLSRITKAPESIESASKMLKEIDKIRRIQDDLTEDFVSRGINLN